MYIYVYIYIYTICLVMLFTDFWIRPAVVPTHRLLFAITERSARKKIASFGTRYVRWPELPAQPAGGDGTWAGGAGRWMRW